MEFKNEIKLPMNPDDLFDYLLDVEKVIPCIPGAALERVEDGVYHASVRLKVGPVALGYKGTAQFLDINRESRTAVLKASGAETRGQGKASATIRTRIEGNDTESTLTMETDLAIRGRVAQFGRGVLNDVSENLVNQFAANFKAQTLTSDAGADDAEAVQGVAATNQTPRSHDNEADNSTSLPIGLVVMPLVKRIAPLLLAVVLGFVLGRRR